MESGLPFHFQLLDFTLTWKVIPFLFSSIHLSCQFTGSSTHTSIYRQFHSSVYRRFNPYINLQAVPLTHQFTGNSINTKNACTIYIRVQVIPSTQKVHTPFTPIYRQFHTPLTPTYRQFHTPFTQLIGSSIHHSHQLTGNSIHMQFHTPRWFTSNSIHKFAGYSSRTQSTHTIYRHFQSPLTSSLYNLLLKIFTIYTHITNSSKPLTDVV